MIERFVSHRILPAVLLAACLVSGSAVAAEFVARPLAAGQQAAPLVSVARHEAASLDLTALARDDADREAAGMPYRFAGAENVALTPANSGTWESLPTGEDLWRLRIGSPGALSLNLGFTRFWLPIGARLAISATDGSSRTLVFDERDNRSHGQLWTPLLENDELVVELLVPANRRDAVDLVLGAVNSGYRPFVEPEKAQWCEIDVVCPEGDDWRDEIDTVGVYTVNGVWKCTGTLMNNTAQDGRALFLTAHHCDIKVYTQDYSATVVVYWNFQSPGCGDLGGGSLTQFQSGSSLLADYPAADMTLIELDEIPDPAFGVKYAGWDRSETVPGSAVCIHHPATGVKCISFENDPLYETSWSQEASPGDGTHLMVEDWDVGTTEGGSSGSALFNAEHRVVGQLHGGWASCDNDEPDWYGRLAVSWDGAGTADSRLSDHLDPASTGAMTADLYVYVPAGYPFDITWTEVWQPSGLVGGPFRPAAGTVDIENTDTENRTVVIESSAAWMAAAETELEIPALGTSSVQVGLTAAAASLPAGVHEGVLAFVDEMGGGRREHTVTLRIGAEAGLQLTAAYPNPFRSWVEMSFEMDYAADCHMKVFDLRGRLVRDLGWLAADRGDNTIAWDCLTDDGGRAAAGTYVLHVESGGSEVTRAVTLIH